MFGALTKVVLVVRPLLTGLSEIHGVQTDAATSSCSRQRTEPQLDTAWQYLEAWLSARAGPNPDPYPHRGPPPAIGGTEIWSVDGLMLCDSPTRNATEPCSRDAVRARRPLKQRAMLTAAPA